MSYPNRVAYDRDLDPDLRGTVDFNFFGDDEEEGEKVSNSIGNKASVVNSAPSQSDDRMHNGSGQRMRKTSAGSDSQLSSSEYSDRHDAARSPVYKRSSAGMSSSENEDEEDVRGKQKSENRRNDFDPQSPLSTPQVSPRSSRSNSYQSQSSTSSSRIAQKSSSSAASSYSATKNSAPIPRPSKEDSQVHKTSSARSSLSNPSPRHSSMDSRRSSPSASSSRSNVSRSSSVDERRPVPPAQDSYQNKPSKVTEEDALSEVTEVSPLTSPEFVSPIGSPQAQRKKVRSESNSQRGKPPVIDFSTKSHSRRSRPIEKDEVTNPVDEDKLDISLLLSALSEIDNKPSLAYKPRGASSGRPAWVDPTSKNHTFTKVQSWDIEKENQRLLHSLLSGNKAANKNKTPLFPGGDHVAQIKRPHHSTLNRQRQQRKIEIENQYILARIRAVGPTPTITRDYLLKSYAQQMQYGLPQPLKKSISSRVITRDPVTFGLGGYRGSRGQPDDSLNSDDRGKYGGGRRSNTHRGMGDDSSQREHELKVTTRRRPQSANAASRGSNAALSPSDRAKGIQPSASQSMASSHRMASDRPPTNEKRLKTSHNGRSVGSGPSSRASSSLGNRHDESDASSRIVSSRREWLTGW